MSGRKKTEYVEITEDIQQKIEEYIETTGIASMAILRGDRLNKPPKLKSYTIEGWRKGTTKRARKDDLDYVIDKWEALLNGGDVRIELTPERIFVLRAEQERTKATTRSLLRMFKDWPSGLDEKMISRMLTGGDYKVLKSHYDFLLARYTELPTPDKQLKKPVISTDEFFATPPDFQEKMDYLHRRMRVGYFEVDGKKIAIPDILVNRTKKLTKEDVERVLYLIENLKGTPPRETRGRANSAIKPGFVALTIDIRMALYNHITRTLVPPGDIIRNDPVAPRPGARIVACWINGIYLTVRKEHLDYMLHQYEKLPDYPYPDNKSGS